MNANVATAQADLCQRSGPRAAGQARWGGAKRNSLPGASILPLFVGTPSSACLAPAASNGPRLHLEVVNTRWLRVASPEPYACDVGFLVGTESQNGQSKVHACLRAATVTNLTSEIPNGSFYSIRKTIVRYEYLKAVQPVLEGILNSRLFGGSDGLDGMTGVFFVTHVRLATLLYDTTDAGVSSEDDPII